VLVVPEGGVEPPWSQAPLDFESSASTSFTTPASSFDFNYFRVYPRDLIRRVLALGAPDCAHHDLMAGFPLSRRFLQVFPIHDVVAVEHAPALMA
jgi:hypothetical protein